ncbi:Mini-ribonuclease 3 [Sporosalibacterium faouarense]|uniref:Mini-ribonuclease 3 n=1 Tax=Sporosalibacterium faouarense TaxID=516123 RepID=UPI00311C8FE4
MEKNIGDYMNDNTSDFLNKSRSDWTEMDARLMSPLQLAYLGDAVYEVLVRTYLVDKKKVSVNELHKEAVNYVKAEAQAKIAFFLEEKLTEEEWSVLKRGRNAKSASVPKNASISDYKYATGFEALIGYLYIKGDIDRILWLFDEIVND